MLPVELILRDHYGRETTVIIRKLPAILGRDECADVQLADPWVSHLHCEIDQLGSTLVVKDLGSKNGVFCSHRVSESHVLSGERLTVGRTEIVVYCRCIAHTAIEAEINEPPKQKPGQTKPPETVELLY